MEKQKRKKHSSSSSSSEADEWVEKSNVKAAKDMSNDRDDWMSMTGVLKTYTKEDIKPKRETNDKNHIDSYNPGSSTRELNPYWKNGGSGLPQTPESFRASKQFLRPSSNDNESFYSKGRDYKRPEDDNYHRRSDYSRDKSDRSSRSRSQSYSKSGSWRRGSDADPCKPKKYDKEPDYKTIYKSEEEHIDKPISNNQKTNTPNYDKIKQLSKSDQKDVKYLSDEKMNKLAAKIVKAEIMGDMKTVNELKTKLEEAREYRKQNPNAGKEDEYDSVMLMSTNAMGNSRPLSKTSQGDARSKGGKRKAETHQGGERQKYFGNDDKYNLAEMFEQEKYGTNYDNDAELAKIVSKHKNPNDDLEDIFTDEISKNRNASRDDLKERERAIKQHVKIERSLEGCQYCMDSKSMLKHMMVSCGSRVYVALPSRKSLVEGHCFISTIQHATCVTAIDEDVWEEIMDYRKALTQFFNSQNLDVVFFETATRLHKYPHMVINCVPMARDTGDMAPIYFKKALLECEAEWAMNKKVVELKGKNIRKGVPKGLPYFWVDFGMDPGFAHVIEDQQLFPKNFAEEIIGGILDLDHNLWKNPPREHGEQQRKKVLEFVQKWKPYDSVANK